MEYFWLSSGYNIREALLFYFPMKNAFSDSNQIRKVSSFPELVNTKFQGETNAICWHRNLVGDFKEIVNKLQLKENITEVSVEDLLALQLSQKGNLARAIILEDIEQLTDFGASPVLNLLKNYERDEELDFISTDVYSFHVDRSPLKPIHSYVPITALLAILCPIIR